MVVTFNNVTRTVTPNFSFVASMADVAVAITNALNLAANFGANAFTNGTYDAATQRFTIVSANNAQNITQFDAASSRRRRSSGWRALTWLVLLSQAGRNLPAAAPGRASGSALLIRRGSCQPRHGLHRRRHSESSPSTPRTGIRSIGGDGVSWRDYSASIQTFQRANSN